MTDVLSIFEQYPKHFGRFMAQVQRDGDCWRWTGADDSVGYGTIKIDGKVCRVHRVAHELFKGPIPDGLVIDHLCRNRLCVNPEHLEAVTNRQNVLRGQSGAARNAQRTHCRRGHPFDEANTYRYRGMRYCKRCQRDARARA